MTEKLTKKQKKGLAFRQYKGKGKQQHVGDELGRDVPVAENQDEHETDGLEQHPQAEDKGRQQQQSDEPAKKSTSKKRKRDDAEEKHTENEPAKQAKSKRRKPATTLEDGVVNTVADTSVQEKDEKKSARRYILFVGNLKYSTTKEALQKHFSKCDPPPTIRLLTPKSAKTPKSKGCAFVEFSHRNALQQALKLHHSELEGRKINVELTAGGGGKSEKRLNKVKERNRGLATQRTKQIQKLKRAKGDRDADAEGDVDAELSRPQRHSSTSGIDQALLKKRTWSVPDGDDVDTTHHGGRKHRKGKQRRPKALGTGVNAIPVG